MDSTLPLFLTVFPPYRYMEVFTQKNGSSGQRGLMRLQEFLRVVWAIGRTFLLRPEKGSDCSLSGGVRMTALPCPSRHPQPSLPATFPTISQAGGWQRE